jgi:outer membrane protein OmpA-like peptidoglycan-associated protein
MKKSICALLVTFFLSIFSFNAIAQKKNAAGGKELFEAVKTRNTARALDLIKQGANLNYEAEGDTILTLAIRNRDTEMAKVLLAAGADPNLKTLPWAGTPLRMAVQMTNVEMVMLLIDKYKADVNPKNDSGYSILHCAVDFNADEKITALLLAAGSNPNVINKDGQTPYEFALVRGKPAIAKLLAPLANSPVVVATPSCPSVNVSSPDSVSTGELLTFTVNVSGGDSNVNPTYQWTVSTGKIFSGQGTSSITVETFSLAGQSVTATVDVGGFARQCSVSSSGTTAVIKKIEPRKIDEYSGRLNPKDQYNRLDKFADELKSDSASTAYIITYGDRKSSIAIAQKTADAASQYLVTKRGIVSKRITVVIGGYRENQTVELWIVPAGVQPPAASPTVDPSEVTAVNNSQLFVKHYVAYENRFIRRKHCSILDDLS